MIYDKEIALFMPAGIGECRGLGVVIDLGHTFYWDIAIHLKTIFKFKFVFMCPYGCVPACSYAHCMCEVPE